MLTFNILLLNRNNFKNKSAVSKFGVCNHVNWGNTRLITRASLVNSDGTKTFTQNTQTERNEEIH